MKWKMFPVVLVLVTLLSNPASAGPAERDGAFWQSLSADMRTMLIAGVFEGMSAQKSLNQMTCYEGSSSLQEKQACNSAASDRNELTSKLYVRTKTVGQILGGVDDFYSDYRNLAIPIGEAVFVVIRRINGEPNVETYVANIRKLY